MDEKIEDILRELREAKVAYEDANQRCREARTAETAALNDLNQAQKKLDAAVTRIRKEFGPRDSDWNLRSMRAVSE